MLVEMEAAREQKIKEVIKTEECNLEERQKASLESLE